MSKASQANNTLRPCCPKMAAEIVEDNVFAVVDLMRRGSPRVYACSDGGHGGMAEISFCPFCGRPIVFVQSSVKGPGYTDDDDDEAGLSYVCGYAGDR